MRKVLSIVFLTLFLVLFFVPAPASAGLVPCGLSVDDPDQPGDQTEACELCDLFVMFDRVVKVMLFKTIPVLAALMIAIGGAMYILAFLSSEGAPAMLSRAKKLFGAVAIGLLIIYGAWVIVNTFLFIIGALSWEGFGGGWWIINC